MNAKLLTQICEMFGGSLDLILTKSEVILAPLDEEGEAIDHITIPLQTITNPTFSINNIVQLIANSDIIISINEDQYSGFGKYKFTTPV